MSTTPFFRLPIISFLATFGILFAQLVSKLNSLDFQSISYHSSPDFMRIIGVSLLVMLSFSICLNSIKIYRLTMRNILFVIIMVVLALVMLYGVDIYLTDLLSAVFNIDTAKSYHYFLFWYPVISRILGIVVVFFVAAVMTYFVKHHLHWQDESCDTDMLDNDVAKRVQVVYLICGYLATTFIFQRYLYIAVYLFLGNGNLPEMHNFSFYLSSIMTAFLLLIYLNSQVGSKYIIDGKIVVKTTALIIVSQLVISIIVSFITIYAVQYYFVSTMPDTDVARYSHYLALIYVMLNSIFVVAILTCLLTYFAGRFWLKKYALLQSQITNWMD